MHRGKGIAAAAVAAVVLLLLVWGSGSGAQVLSSPSGEVGPAASPTRTPPAPSDIAAQTTATNVLEPAAPTLDWLMIFFAVVCLAIFIKVIQWLLHRDWEQSEAPDEDELIDDLDLLLEATSVTTRASALTEGEPRNVVVRCWVALEDAADASGLPRDSAETAAEFTRRFLGVWDVDEALTQELAELYREARFSRHPVSRVVGDRAVELVGSIHEQLRASDARRVEAEATAASTTGSSAPGSSAAGSSAAGDGESS